MFFRYVVRQVDDVLIFVIHALCPPICLLRSLAVAPSAKLVPVSMEFLPYLFFMAMSVSFILRSLASEVGDAA